MKLSDLARNAAATRSRTAFQYFAFVVVAGTTVLVTLFVDKWGEDSFRLPKEVLFRAGAIALLAGFAFAATSATPLWPQRREWRRAPVVIALAAVVWTLIATLASSSTATSVQAFVTVVCSVVLFLGMVCVFRGERSPAALDFAFAPAVVNAIVVVLQEYGIWQPFEFPATAKGHMSSSALIGNPNDVGAFLVAPAVAAAIATTVVRGVRRVVYSVIALVLLAGIVASGTRTALGAYVIALLVFVAFRSRRNMTVVLGLIVVVIAFALVPSTPLGKRVHIWREALANRRYDVVFSQRLPPFLAAAEMWRDHPLTGIGPGCFKVHYMPYRLAIDGKYPHAWLASYPEMFGETHNDHLQLLAEAGVPAYALFLATLAAIALPAIRIRSASDFSGDFRNLFGRELRLPLAAAIFIVALAQFPLQLAAPRTMFLYFAALCFAWDDHAA